MEGAGRAEREHEDVGDDRHFQAAQSEPAQKFVVLSHVVAGLIDDKTRSSLNLAPQLEVLGHQLALVTLVVRHDRPEEEVRRLHPPSLPVAKAAVHLRVHGEQPHRVDVEARASHTPVSRFRIVPCEGENVVESLRGQLPAAALKRIPVTVFASQVNDHFLTNWT